MRIVVTGGAGYIGSHAAALLLERGHEVVVLDALLPGRADPSAVDRLRAIAGGRSAALEFHHGDVTDPAALDRVMTPGGKIDAVMHFAGVAYVAESVRDPLMYHRINTTGTLEVLRACARAGVKRLVYSSSCVTYGDPGGTALPIVEDCPTVPMNPYGWSKLHAERVIRDHASATPGFSCAILRYFNVAGCDRRGRLGHSHDPETRVIPLCLRAALGIDERFVIFGDDYPTPTSPDGTALRDYIHVDDLVRAHLAVLEALRPGDTRLYNLGTGRGVSVAEIIRSVERVTGRPVPRRIGPRRPGDPASLYCSPERIARELGWKAEITDLDEIVRSSWRWMTRGG